MTNSGERKTEPVEFYPGFHLTGHWSPLPKYVLPLGAQNIFVE